jgi:NADPH-dependent glutamate synthase beta subunit-like oxidoreductase
MSLENAVESAGGHKTIKESVEKLNNESLCSECGEPGEETEFWYWRCKNDNCDVNNYIPVPVSLSYEQVN